MTGCTKYTNPDTKVYYQSSTEVTTSLKVRQLNASTVVHSSTLTLPAGTESSYGEVFETNNVPHQITTKLEDGSAATKQWSQRNESTSLRITITATDLAYTVVHRDNC